ncbi:uncharacterized protein LOC144478295 [Augochlora pura]
MFENVAPRKAMKFVRFSVGLICAWPLPSAATKAQVLCFRTMKALNILSALGLFFPVLYAMIRHRDDAIEFTKAGLMLIACAQLLTQILICSVQYDRFQRLIENVTASFENANSNERCVYRRYINKYSKFYGLAALWYYVSSTVVVIGSIFLPQPFPTVSEYPFRVDYEPVRTIIFVHQAFVGYQCSAAVCVNMFAAVLILYAAARFEILMTDLKGATSYDALTACVRKYHVATGFAKDVVKGTKYIALFTVVYSGIALVLCGLNIIGRQPFVVKLQFCGLAWVSLVEVFMCVLPADNLINMSENTVRSAYESKWYDQVLHVQKTVLRILVPQVPVAINIKCIIPILSLEYYCSFVSNAVSLFTVLRMLFGKDADLASSISTNNTHYNIIRLIRLPHKFLQQNETSSHSTDIPTDTLSIYLPRTALASQIAVLTPLSKLILRGAVLSNRASTAGTISTSFHVATMFSNVTPRQAIAFTKYSVILCCGWPLPSTATRRQYYVYIVLKLVSALIGVVVILPVFFALYLYIDDPVITAKTFGLGTALIQTIVNMFICSVQHDDYQRLIEEMKNYLDKAESYEMAVFQKYLDKYSPYHGLSTMIFFLSSAFIVVSCIFSEQPFPTISEYPFRVDYEPLRTAIFINHAFTAFQNVSSVSLNTLTALLLLFAAARFDILMLTLQEAVTVADLKECMKRYDDIKRYAHDVIGVIKYISLSSIVFSSIILVNGGINIIGHSEFAVKCEFVCVVIVTLIEVFSCVLPADSLIEASTCAISSVYNMKWYEQDLNVQKTVLRMLVPQKSIDISFVYIIPQLSLNYYCSYISGAFSLFTVLRFALDDSQVTASSNNLNTTCCYD